MREPTIAAGFARGLLDVAVAKGADRDLLLRRSGINAADLEDQDNRIPMAKYVALMRSGKELARDAALALHFGEAFDIGQMSVVGMIGRTSQTMSDGFSLLNRYSRLIADVGPGDRFHMTRDDAGLWLVDARPDPNDFPEMTESTFARIAGSTRRMFGPHAIRAVRVTHPAPPYRREYDRIFRAPIAFESTMNALAFDDEWLSRRIALTSPDYVSSVLRAHADALLERLESASSLRGRVEAIVIGNLRSGTLSIETTAQSLGMSRQTLFRRLKSEGVTFERIVDELRRKLAEHYLREKKASVGETAYLVGFSDPAAFSRA